MRRGFMNRQRISGSTLTRLQAQRLTSRDTVGYFEMLLEAETGCFARPPYARPAPLQAQSLSPGRSLGEVKHGLRLAFLKAPFLGRLHEQYVLGQGS
jgi:hypothetical protein